MYAAHRGHVESVKALLADKRTNVKMMQLLEYLTQQTVPYFHHFFT